jgi:protease-4
MKDFLKYTLATVTGLVITGVIFFFIGIMVISGIAASSDTSVTVKKNSILMLNLDGQLSERVQDKPWTRIFGNDDQSIGLDNVLSAIKKAKSNEDIKGIYIQAKLLSSSFASYQEIRDALLDFKKSKKFIIAYSDTYTQGLYYLSSVADKIILNPQGSIAWKGLATQITYMKNLFDKLGVEQQVFKVGTFKSAVEPLTSTSMSDANRLQMTELLGSLWGRMVKDVAASRHLSPSKLNEIADNGTVLFNDAKMCVSTHMADTLLYKSDVKDYLKKKVGIDKDDNLNILGINDMTNVKDKTSKDKSGNEIAVYYACGDIVDESSTSSSLSDEQIVGDEVVSDLRDLRENDDVKAVVLRVNSPGGSAFASEQIWHAIQLLKAKKPVVVSMGDYAASGGYYISCGANKIVAEPTTLTGSIGIFGVIPNFTKLANKIGLTFDGVKTNKMSDLGVLGTSLTPEEKSLIQMRIANGYNTFVSRCAQGRKMSKSAIESIAQGRVWSGEKALKLGLVDEMGNIDKAIAIAAKLSKISNYSVTSYPEQKSILSTLLKEKPDNYIETKLLKSRLGNYYEAFSFINSLQKQSTIQARIPFFLNIN